MAIKKSELYSSLWASCDELRGGMDASQYKDYVLVLLFIKYVSDKYAGKPFAPITIPEGAGFTDMVALKGKPDIGDQINKNIVAPLAAANEGRLSLADFPDFNDPNKLGSGREMVDRLTNLIAIFETPALDFSKNRAEGDDILGDAYEYLMRHFATESGKSKGQFYTPAEVSRIMAKVIGIGTAVTTPQTTVYDPTCGSGSLLLKVADEATAKVALYGQEKDATTSGLARMNMFLHDYGTAEILQGNTLADPKFKNAEGALKTFDYVVANPPFSDKRWSTGVDTENDPHGRFTSFGVPPDKQGDYAYLLHIVRSLKSTGTGACILPHGVLFRGNAEAVIRKKLIRKGYLKGIIGLPANLFYGTGIPACILVLDKAGATARKGIFMVDASSGFQKDGNKNRLRSRDIHKIVDVFSKSEDLPGFARLVPVSEIEKNDFNLNLPRYIDNPEAEDIQDIDAHLRGGIPVRDLDGLGEYWDVLPKVRQSLFFQSQPSPAPPADSGLHPAYFDTHFEQEEAFDDWPENFAIITAHATTGEKWSEAKNQKADAALHSTLEKHSGWIRRLTGFSPLTGHAEPGWAVDVDYENACDVGLIYKQDGIYFVSGDTLDVSLCADKDRQRVKVGPFRERVHLPSHPPFRARPGYEYLAVETSAIQSAIHDHPEFGAFIGGMSSHFGEWRDRTATFLRGLKAECHPKEIIEQLSEDLLDHYTDQPLLDRYAVYQHLMDYWSATMQDDTYLIAADGWKAETTRVIEKNTKSGKETDKGWVCDLVPKAILVARYFADEQAAIETQRTGLETAVAGRTELEEEHGGEDGAFAELEKINKGEVGKRLKEIAGDPGSADEITVLERWIAFNKTETEQKRAIKAAEAELDDAAYAKYPELSEDEVKTLVVDDKWLAALETAIHGEMDRISQGLTSRVKELAERYETPVGEMTERVGELEAKVNAHLERMGFSWT